MVRPDEQTTADVVVVGGGPAGAAAAAVLAEYGHQVVVLEKDTFPRYRVGESLIPYCWFQLHRLGLIENLDRSSFVVRKHSVQFVDTDGQATTPFYFFEHSDHDSSRTWQVMRGDFDMMLLENAAKQGARVRFNIQARELITDGGRVVGVHARTTSGADEEIRAAITIDASGRDLFSVLQHGWRIADPMLKKIAIWTYYRGALRECGINEGATTIAYLPDKGWFWYIPLPEDTIGVGVVAGRDYLYRGERDPDAIFAREAEVQPWIRQRLALGEKIQPCRVTGDYSYRSKYCAADGLVLAGDAFAFLDPVFSSGVFLALQSGVLAGDAVHSALRAADVSAARFGEYSEHFCHGIEAMRRLVYAFYDTAFSFGAFLKKHPELRGDLTDCLIGNVNGNLEPLFSAVAEFAEIPKRLPHGGPTPPTPPIDAGSTDKMTR